MKTPEEELRHYAEQNRNLLDFDVALVTMWMGQARKAAVSEALSSLAARFREEAKRHIVRVGEVTTGPEDARENKAAAMTWAKALAVVEGMREGKS